MTRSLAFRSLPESDDLPFLWKRHTGLDLTPTQLHYVDQILALIPEHGSAVLKGVAGTGKSTVTVATIVAAVRQGYEVRVAAPTHKATKVLADPLVAWERRLGVILPVPATVHALLSLKPKRTKPGEPESYTQSRIPDLRGVDLLIVDECSMVGAELHRYLMDAVERSGVALICAGDPAQLQPVNESRVSPTFGLPKQFELTEVVRHDGAVLQLATRARKLGRPQVLPARSGGSAVVTYDHDAALEEAWLDRVAEAHETGDPSSVVMLAWTNQNRRRFNKRAREKLYGVDVPDFMAGDQVVTLAPVEQDGQLVWGNNADLQVEAAQQLAAFQPVDAVPCAYSVWKLWIKESGPIYVLGDGEESRHKKDVTALGKEIAEAVKETEKKYLAVYSKKLKEHLADELVTRKDPEVACARDAFRNAKERWNTEYFPLKNAFAQVDFGYAVTIHKSQGSTYKRVFVYSDYAKNNHDAERKQLLYVAVTRAASEVHHVYRGIGAAS